MKQINDLNYYTQKAIHQFQKLLLIERRVEKAKKLLEKQIKRMPPEDFVDFVRITNQLLEKESQ